MCCLVLANPLWTKSGKTRCGLSPETRFGRRSPANWTNPGNWAWIRSLDNSFWFVIVADWAWFVIVPDCTGTWKDYIYAFPDLWRLKFDDVVLHCLSSSTVVCPRKTFTTLLVCESDVLPVFYCRGHFGDTSIFFCLFVWSYLRELDVVLCPCRVYRWS